MRPSSALAIVIAVVTAVANASALLFVDFFGPLIVLPYALGTYAGVGVVLALIRPWHPVGWLFLACGCCFALWSVLGPYAWRALVDAPGTLPAGELAAWLYSFLWLPAVGSLVIALTIFPTGRPLSRRWAGVLAVMVAAFVANILAGAVAPELTLPSPFATGEPQNSRATIPNPSHATGALADALLMARPYLSAAIGLPVVLVVVTAVVTRYVRASGIERLQLKWFAYAASISLGSIALSFVAPRGVIGNLAWAGGMAAAGLIPVAAAIAILRYRLYDIDLLINRTLVYGALTASLLATYFAGVVVFQAALRPLTGGGEVAVALSTLAVVALFQPLRRRVQGAVDRRFYRSRYDAARTLDAFSARLRNEVDLDEVRADLLAAVQETVRPRHASVWLRVARR